MNKRQLTYLLAAVLLMASCTKKNTASNADKKFVLSDTMARMITLDTAKTEQVEDELDLTGKVTYDDSKVIKIFPLVAGTVQDVKVELGDYVQKGQILAVIRSSQVADLQQQKINADNDVLITKKNLDATEQMYKSGVSSEKDYFSAQKDYENAQAAQRKVSSLYGIYDVSTDGNYVIKSPIAGFIVEKNINNAMQVREDNGSNFFTISSLDQVWVTANVYETDIDKIKEGYEADVTTISYGSRVFKGKVDKVFNALDPDTKVMKARIVLNNTDYALKPEMFAGVSVYYQENKQAITIPSSAVIFNLNKNYVIVYHDKANLEIKPLDIYKVVGGKTYLNGGLQPGDKVVSKFATLVFEAMNK